MRELNECLTYEVRQPDGSWKRAYLEQIDIGDVVRCFTPNGEMRQYKNSQTGEDTPHLTFISQAAFNALHGDFSAEVTRELVKRSQVIPGHQSPAATAPTVMPDLKPETDEHDLDGFMKPAKKTRRPRAKKTS